MCTVFRSPGIIRKHHVQTVLRTSIHRAQHPGLKVQGKYSYEPLFIMLHFVLSYEVKLFQYGGLMCTIFKSPGIIRKHHVQTVLYTSIHLAQHTGQKVQGKYSYEPLFIMLHFVLSYEVKLFQYPGLICTVFKSPDMIRKHLQ